MLGTLRMSIVTIDLMYVDFTPAVWYLHVIRGDIYYIVHHCANLNLCL